MNAVMSYRGLTYKTVRVSGVTIEDDAAILAAAMQAAGETQSSLFGWTISRQEDPTVAYVSLHTD